jgi:hypothetical protein
MKEKTMRKKTILISILLILLVSGGYQYGYIAHNYTCIVYPEQCPDGKEISGQPLGILIVEAASFFLQSNSDYQSFLKNFENSAICGVNFATYRELIDNAVENIESAHLKYLKIWEIAKSLDYDPLVLAKLERFDYQKFQEENHLNPSIFKEVSEFLKTGNVTGIYERSYNNTGDILRELRTIKISIDSGRLPAVKDCWRINQGYLGLELFGQYVSQVFFEIK